MVFYPEYLIYFQLKNDPVFDLTRDCDDNHCIFSNYFFHFSKKYIIVEKLASIRALYPTINSNVTKRKTGNLYSTITSRIRLKKRLFIPTIACVHNIRHIRSSLNNVNKSYSK